MYVFALAESVQTALVVAGSSVVVAIVGAGTAILQRRETRKVGDKIGEPDTNLSSQMTKLQEGMEELHHGHVSMADRLSGVERTQIEHTGELNQVRKMGVELCAKLEALDDKTNTQGVSIWDHDTRITGLEKRVEKLEAKDPPSPAT